MSLRVTYSHENPDRHSVDCTLASVSEWQQDVELEIISVDLRVRLLKAVPIKGSHINPTSHKIQLRDLRSYRDLLYAHIQPESC